MMPNRRVLSVLLVLALLPVLPTVLPDATLGGGGFGAVAAPRAFSAGDMLISEFRLSGPLGSGDEYVELYNATSSVITVSASDASAGWALAASDGVARFVIPNGTVIPAHGHYLGVGSQYSLAN